MVTSVPTTVFIQKVKSCCGFLLHNFKILCSSDSCIQMETWEQLPCMCAKAAFWGNRQGKVGPLTLRLISNCACQCYSGNDRCVLHCLFRRSVLVWLCCLNCSFFKKRVLWFTIWVETSSFSYFSLLKIMLTLWRLDRAMSISGEEESCWISASGRPCT